MSTFKDNAKLVTTSLYTRAYTQFGQLERKLPEEAVMALAQEVLLRLADQLSAREVPSDALVIRLAEALISPDAKAAADFIEERHRQGADAMALYLSYLAPAAQKLGTWWTSDEISFANVTVGTGRIYAIMRNLSARFPRPPLTGGKRALFAAVPNDDHSLGVVMAADLCRKAGWQIDLLPAPSHDEIIEAAIRGDHRIIGLSGGGLHAQADLARLVLALRVTLPQAHILVSGNIVNEAGENVQLMDVDAMTPDFEEARDAIDGIWAGLTESQT